jgi:glycine betaine/proline transport system permease protein
MYEKKATFREITKFISQILNIIVQLFRDLLLGGTKTIKLILGDSFVSKQNLFIPATPWPAMVCGVALIGYKLGGRNLALLGGISALYIAIFGQWTPSVQTFSFILVTTPICFVLGLSLGYLGIFKQKSRNLLTTFIKYYANNATVCLFSANHSSFWIRRSCGFNSNDHYCYPPYD